MKNTAIFIQLVLLPFLAGAQYKNGKIFDSPGTFDFTIDTLNEQIILPANDRLLFVSQETGAVEGSVSSSQNALILSVVLDMDKDLIYAGDREGKLCVYSREGKLVNTFDFGGGSIYDLEFNKEKSRLLAALGDGRLILQDLSTPGSYKVLYQSDKPVYCALFTEEGIPVGGFSDGTLKIFEGNDYENVQSVKVHRGIIRDISRDGNSIYSVGDDDKIIEYNLKLGTSNQVRFRNYTDDVLCVDYFANPNILVAGNYSGDIRLNLITNNYKAKLNNPVIKCRIRIYPDKSIRIFALCLNGELYCLDSEWMELEVFKKPSSAVK